MAGVFALFMTMGALLQAQTSLYWDLKNGSGAGTAPVGNWDTTSSNWNTTATGTGSAGVWTNGNIAVFSAGTDATGTYNVTITSAVSAASITAQEGNPTITGGTLTLTGGGIDVASTASLTINSAIAGSAGITKTNSGTLTLGGSNTYTGTTTVTGGTLQAGANLNFSSGLDLGAGTTLALNGNSVTVGTLNITGNSVIDFGSAAASTLSVSTLNLSAGATLTINGWADMVDYFLVGTFTGATVEVRGSGTSAQVVFSGYAGSSTLWNKYGEITPVPEPSSYGALFLMLSTGGYLWPRRRRRA